MQCSAKRLETPPCLKWGVRVSTLARHNSSSNTDYAQINKYKVRIAFSIRCSFALTNAFHFIFARLISFVQHNSIRCSAPASAVRNYALQRVAVGSEEQQRYTESAQQLLRWCWWWGRAINLTIQRAKQKQQCAWYFNALRWMDRQRDKACQRSGIEWQLMLARKGAREICLKLS